MQGKGQEQTMILLWGLPPAKHMAMYQDKHAEAGRPATMCQLAKRLARHTRELQRRERMGEWVLYRRCSLPKSRPWGLEPISKVTQALLLLQNHAVDSHCRMALQADTEPLPHAKLVRPPQPSRSGSPEALTWRLALAPAEACCHCCCADGAWPLLLLLPLGTRGATDGPPPSACLEAPAACCSCTDLLE